MENLFVYGTLLYDDIQEKVFGRASPETSFDALHNYENRIVDEGEDHACMLHPKNGVRVNGLVLTVSEEELSKIDEYEGNLYKRICVELVSGNKAWVYVSPALL